MGHIHADSRKSLKLSVVIHAHVVVKGATKLLLSKVAGAVEQHIRQ